jgi:hypothetical protein
MAYDVQQVLQNRPKKRNPLKATGDRLCQFIVIYLFFRGPLVLAIAVTADQKPPRFQEGPAGRPSG